MICAVHQPQFMPYLGYLAKLAAADVFVVLDNVQFKKNEYQNRNRILVQHAAQWLTVPVRHQFGAHLNQVAISGDNWQSKLWRTLQCNYAGTPYFAQYAESLQRLLVAEPWQNLAELNLACLDWLMAAFQLETPIVLASALPACTAHPTQRLVEICQHLKATAYLSGAGGHDYLETERFAAAGLELRFQNFAHPCYAQFGGGDASGQFISHLSALDALFNLGSAAAQLVR